MEAFLTPAQRARRLAAFERRRNPAPGRTSADNMRIRRTLHKIKERIDHWLQVTEFQPMKGWLPFEDIVTAQDDDYLRDFYAAYTEEGEVDEDGYLLQFHDAGIKATNRITCVTWYLNKTGGEFLLAKNLYSPLPCDEWGRAPLNLTHWRIIAPQLIVSTQLWQWLHAVRSYLDDDSFEIGGFMGWHLQECNKVTSQAELRSGPGYMFDSERVGAEEQMRDAHGWTGHIIYKHITDEYSQLVSKG